MLKTGKVFVIPEVELAICSSVCGTLVLCRSCLPSEEFELTANLGEGGGTVNHGAQRIKAFISKSSHGNSVAASSVLMFRITPFIN